MKNLITTLAILTCVGSAFAQCCGAKAQTPEDKFLAEAQAMTMAAEGKKACCKSTVEKPVAKGEAGCCNAKGETPKFKVFVAGEGYKFFGCAGSATQGRQAWAKKGARVGKVQAVAAR